MKELNKVAVQDVNGGALGMAIAFAVGFYLGSMNSAH